MKFRFSKAAAREHAEQAAFYFRRDPKVAHRYVDAVARTVETICSFAQAYPPAGIADCRYAPVAGFPLWIVYALHDPWIEIIAIAHQRRRRGYWQGRV